MNKYLAIIKIYWQRGLVYRFTILAYRIGEVAEIIALILMWTAIYSNQQLIKGFTLPEMITYILVGNLFSGIARNLLSDIIAQDIKNGKLSMFLVKPITYFNFIFFREIGRMSIVTSMAVSTQLLVISFFAHSFIFNYDLQILAVIFVMVILAFITELLLSFLVGLIAFWTEEVDGVYSTIDRLKKFFAGSYFPLNLLPEAFLNVSFLLPFAYSFFVPALLYLKKVDISMGLKGILVQIVWIIILYAIIHFVWKRGIKRYEGVGI